MAEIPRAAYRRLLGPTTGDRIRLADTDLLIEVEADHCFGGDEVIFGGGKVIRESMGQSRATRAEGAPDLVITGAVILDHWGVVKADIGVRDGRIVGIGKAGNPDTMDGVQSTISDMRARADAHGRSLRFGYRVHVVVRETEEGLIVRGSQMLATGGPVTDEVFVTCIKPLGPDDRDFAISFAMPPSAFISSCSASRSSPARCWPGAQTSSISFCAAAGVLAIESSSL